MGGNVTLVVNGKSIRPSPISRKDFPRVREEVGHLMLGIDRAFCRKYGKNLWRDRPAFAGSTRILMSSEESRVLDSVESIGDRDVMIDRSDALGLWDVLRGHHLESINDVSSMKIIGTPATSPRKSGYNLLVDLDGSIIQIDIFATKTPRESFLGHYLSAEDVEMGIKGLFKNKLISEVCKVSTILPGVLLKKHVDLSAEVQFNTLQENPHRLSFSPEYGYRRRIIFDINLEGVDLYLATPLPVRDEDIVDEEGGTREVFGADCLPAEISSFAGCCRKIRGFRPENVERILSGLTANLLEDSHRIGSQNIDRAIEVYRHITGI